MLTETTRTKTLLAIVMLAVLTALVAVVAISTGPVQALLFCAMAASAAIISAMFVVAAN